MYNSNNISPQKFRQKEGWRVQQMKDWDKNINDEEIGLKE